MGPSMICVGLRAIAKKMGWKSPSTPLRHAELYSDPKLNFPLVMRRLGGNRFVWTTTDTLITEWMRQHRKLTPDQQLLRVTRPSKLKPRTVGQTVCDICGGIKIKQKWPKRYHTQPPLGRERE